ncbi:MAG: 4-(cytidine 5'-diphospho)-2-C-methyl-D-erythritol kinase [Planctomycetaceae bacterium]
MLFQRTGQLWVTHTPAKLNLFLEVIDRREDGFHELEMFMVAVDLYDTLTFRTPELPTSQPMKLSVRSLVPAEIPTDQRNLVVKAVDLLRTETGCELPVHIELTKRIPVQAGLGGGSSDAAATLVTLNRMWQLGLSHADLHRLAARLGSDLNFFVEQSAAAVCTGRGEAIQSLDKVASELHFVIVHPGWGLSTAEVFKRSELPIEPQSLEEFVSGFEAGNPSLFNRLTEAAKQIRPEVTALAGLFSVKNSMSGSGSAWYGIVPSRRAATRLANRLRANQLVQTAFAVSMTAS